MGEHVVLSETIAEAVVKLNSTVSLGSLDESATKQGVVLRLLSLAGWNAFDVSEVVPEYTVGSRRVDYALRLGSSNLVFIEVKRPSENLQDHQQQLLEYCFQQGVKLAALTNGRTWWFYLPLQEGSWEQRRFLTIDLESQEPDTVELRFMQYLSRDEVGSGRAVSAAENLVQSQQRVDTISKTVIEAWNQIVERPDELLVELISEATERICGFKPDSEMIEQFLAQHLSDLLVSGSPASPSNLRTFPTSAATQLRTEMPADLATSLGNKGRTGSSRSFPPVGTICRFFYKESTYSGTIEGGRLLVEGIGSFSSFSGASNEISNTSRNGWRDWEIKLPGSNQWQLSDTWRKGWQSLDI